MAPAAGGPPQEQAPSPSLQRSLKGLGAAIDAVTDAGPSRASPRDKAIAEKLALHRLSKADAKIRVEGDLAAVLRYRDYLRSTIRFVDSRPDLFPGAKVETPRTLTDEQKTAILGIWRAFLDHVLALDSAARYHRSFFRADGDRRAKSLAALTLSFLAPYRAANELAERAGRDPAVEALLNEPLPELGLGRDAYAKLKFRFRNIARAGELSALESLFKTLGEGGPAADAIEEDSAFVWGLGLGRRETVPSSKALAVVRRAGFADWLPVAAGVVEWSGDAKAFREGVALVSKERIRELSAKLEPGDIVITRREWRLTGVGLAGYWTGAALYVGTPEERRRHFGDPQAPSGVRSDGDFKDDDGDLVRALAADGEPSPFVSLERAAGADAVAALRPRLSKAQKAEAIHKAFERPDRPLEAFEGVFPSLFTKGRLVLAGNELARIFDSTFETPDQKLDLVAFLDADEQGFRAVEADAAAFRESWKRPKWRLLAAD